MTAYAVLINDRHADPDIELFVGPGRAIKHARMWAQEHATEPSDYEEVKVEGWVFFARYSPEGDWVRVTKHTVQE